jgi:ketosteroid isomerase-like protein
MPRDRVKSAREGIEAYNRRDYERALANFHPDISWEIGSDLVPDARTYRGHAGVREFWNEWSTLFDAFHLEIEEATALGPDRALVVTRAIGRGAASGAPVESPSFFQVFDFEGDQAVRVRMHASREAAVAVPAAGDQPA